MVPWEFMNVAAIDIGSNSIRLLVVGPGGRPGSLRPILRLGEPCRMGRGLHRNGAIEGAMVERAREILIDLVDRARQHGARHIVVAATQAIRSAANQPAVISRLEEACGLRVRVLSGEEEARLVYAAVVESLGALAVRAPCLVFDVGGGSTEVVSGLEAMPGRWVSLPIGAVSLTERFLPDDPPLPDQIAGLEGEVREQLDRGCAQFSKPVSTLAGVGGTVTVLASLHMGLRHYDPRRIESRVIPAGEVSRLADRLAGMSRHERQALPVMGEGRADIVAAGAILARAIVHHFGAPGLICSSQGLRYALARIAMEEARSLFAP